MAERLGTQLQSGGLEQSINSGLIGSGLFGGASLDLNFAATKNLGPLVTFTRASSATYVGSDGLIKTAATNLQGHSELLTAASWVTLATTLTVSGTGPNGNVAYEITEDNTLNSHLLAGGGVGAAGTTSVTSGSVYTGSVFLKRSTVDWIQLTFGGTGFGSTNYINFNLATGVIGNSTGFTGTITPFPNGWYRCTVTGTATATTTVTNNIAVAFTDNTNTTSRLPSYTGSTSNKILATMGQFELGAFPTSYIPTTSTINSAPRFDHNPTTGESLGLLVEELRSNLQGHSELLTAASWSSTNITITASGTGPNGGSAYEITETNVLGSHSFAGGGVGASNVTSVTSGSVYTGSIFLKRSTVDWIQLTFGSAGFGTTNYINFNLATGVIGNSIGFTGTITPFPNGWYRCTVTGTATATTAITNNIVVALTDNTNTTSRLPSYTGSTSNKIFATMGQFELGAFATSYILTTTTTAARNADVASITTVGSDIRSLFAQFRSPASGTRPVVSLDDNTANERIEILTSGTDPKLLVTDGGSAVADLNGGTVTANVTAKAAAVFETNNYAFSVNGGAPQLDSSGTLPTVDRIRIGSNQASGYLNGTIARAVGWDVTLANLPPVTQ